MAFVANDTNAECKEVAQSLPPTVQPCARRRRALARVAAACPYPARALPVPACARCYSGAPRLPARARRRGLRRIVVGQPHSGARCPVRPPGVDETIQMVIQATPDPDEKDFRTLPNSL